LQVLVNNLIENAVKYSPRNSTITVILEKKKENGHPVLMVKDEGPGIPANERKKIFQKFYRIGSEETRTTKGTGLGLFISKKIAADHKASLTVSDNSVPGSIFTVVF
jgi:signal transduction histidine kinase